MNQNEIKVNDTHICVLRKSENENRIKVDFIELKYQYQELLDELEQMANNPNRTVLELQDFVRNSPLKELEYDYNFCTYLDGSYQWILGVTTISAEEYAKKMSELEENGTEGQRIQYASDKRQAYFQKLKRRVVPYMMDRKYYTLNDNPTILAFSHRKVGWASPSFNLNEDIKVSYLTNFGYGNSSYFYTQIHYKGIGILPYSEWVHYRYANTSEIIRYTRRHLLSNEEWKSAMGITAEIYNYAISNPEDFINHYITNEVDEMVTGLERIMNSTKQYQIQYSYFHKNQTHILQGDDFIRFKGEKISGALDFLDQLQTLSSICDNITSYLQRIMNCNLNVIDELDASVRKKKNVLEDLEMKILQVEPLWERIKAKYDEYTGMLDKLWNEIEKEPAFQNGGYWKIKEEQEKRFNKLHPEYETIKQEYEKTHKEYNELCAKRDEAISFIEELQSYLDKIEAHRDYKIELQMTA